MEQSVFFQIGSAIFEGKTIDIVSLYTSKNSYSYAVTKM